MAKVSKQQGETKRLGVHGNEKLHNGEEPPIEEVGEGSPGPSRIDDAEGTRKGVGNATHGCGVVWALRGFRDP